MPIYPFFCGKDCGGDACPMLAQVADGRVVHLTNNPAGGRYLKACQRGFDHHLEHEAPARLLQPLIRSGPRGSGQFRSASWDEALTLTADRLGEIRTRYGASAVLCRGSAGGLGALHATWAVLLRFLHLFGGCTQLTGNYSNGAASYILPYVLGDEWRVSGFDPATMQDAQMIILWGANVLETRQGTEVPQRLAEARRRGAQVVVIDPRRSATARGLGTWWLPCRPGADAALMLAVLHVLITENLVNRPFITAHSVGFEKLERYVLGADNNPACTPAWAAPITGLPAEEITRFARAYAAAKPAMLFPGYSIQRVFAGEEPYRLSVALQIATGNFGQRGGSTGSINSTLPAPRVGSLPAPDIGPQPSLPVVRWPDAILEGRAGGYPTDIHAMYNVGSNALNQGPDIRKNMAGLEKIDFSITHDMFLTATARYCDVVLPVATSFEKEDIGLPWVGNYLLYKPQIFAPKGAARSDYDIFCDLSARLGFGAAYSEGRSASEWIDLFISQSEIPDAGEFKRTGIYLAPDQERVGLAAFRADPAAHPLSTPSGKVEIASQRYHQETGFPAIPTWQAAPEDASCPLRLITPKSPRRTHSQGSNIPAVRRKTPHTLEMHPQDAAARQISEGDAVDIRNPQGCVRVAVRLSEDIMPGVVCLLEGIWVELGPDGVDMGGAANILTATTGTAPGHACIMHGVPVQVARAPD